MLKHVSFLTRDADATLAFYTLLGAVTEKDVLTTEGFRRVVLAFTGGGRLQFFQVGGETPTPHPAWQEHVALVVPDLRARVDTLRTQGVTFTRALTLSPGGRDLAFVLDPDGRQVELLQAD
ncbi:VOC family protein [Deinococcus maricopensis]|uniref:Glyoxalase/bleomycin resistance protein/dioxygenase n=1 Tax=Deinococcus maricopensis (strain DSM 21211 / LMG 22137 / NRRL B-23946 / LB-34) TaxID=709986 RepID=E8UC37_DEIML|nr:VOC family protein [Deinococcus maricopensis]ADV68698.1 Glyoxalase/bleomycin resistance protein/dioxygenase [Deinococcus maricopensis DSM 21211]